jgi:hypothetical protein
LLKENISHTLLIVDSIITYFKTQGLKQRLREIIPLKQAEVKDVRARLGSKILGTCTVEQAYGGMRDVKAMVYETSLLDSHEVNLHMPPLCCPHIKFEQRERETRFD